MNLYDSVRRFDTIPDRDRQTDGRVETSLTTKRRAMQSIERTKMKRRPSPTVSLCGRSKLDGKGQESSR